MLPSMRHLFTFMSVVLTASYSEASNGIIVSSCSSVCEANDRQGTLQPRIMMQRSAEIHTKHHRMEEDPFMPIAAKPRLSCGVIPPAAVASAQHGPLCVLLCATHPMHRQSPATQPGNDFFILKRQLCLKLRPS